MPGKKNPTWTRTRIGRDRVHWVAYDDRTDLENRQVVDQGYAASLPAADAAARAALAQAGMHQARRSSTTSRPARRVDAPSPAPRTPVERPRPREYLYTFQEDREGRLVEAHLIVKKTARRVYVSRRAIGPDQVGSDDESWALDERTIPLDRAILERDGSVFSKDYRGSDFFTTREAAGEPEDHQAAFDLLRLRRPCSVEDIKTAYRIRALQAHPDRGGNPAEFQAIESAYRRLIREARASEGP